MDLWSTVALVVKRRYLAGLMLVLTLGVSIAAVARLAPVFEVNSSLVLLLPSSHSPDGNPYTSGFENQVLAKLVAENLNARGAVDDMTLRGAHSEYAVSPDNGYTAAFIRVSARDRRVTSAERTVALVSEGVQAEVEDLQRATGAPSGSWVRAVPLEPSPRPRLLAGSRIRPLAGLGLASLMATLGMTFLAEGISRRRARKRTGASLTAGAPPWLVFTGSGGGAFGSVRPALGEGAVPTRFPLDAVDALSIFVGLLVILPGRLVFMPLGAAGTPANIWGIVLLLWWIAHRLIPSPPSGQMSFQPVRAAVQFLGVAALISYTAAFFRPIDIVEIFAADRGLISLAAWSGVALVAVDGITSRARLRRLIDRIATAGAGLACLGILQFFTSIDIRPWFKLPFLSVNGDLQLIFINGRSGFNRVAGTTDHPIEFSAVLAMILPLALHLAFHADPTRKRSAWVRVALIGGAVPLSVSRTGILGLVVGGAILFAAWPARRRWQLILLSPVLAVGLRLLIPGLLGSIGSLFLSIQSDTSFTGRTDDYAIAGRLFSQAPFFGRGWGTVLPDRYVLLDNQLLKTLLEGGLLALIALLALFAVGIAVARGSYHRAADAETKDLGQSLTATVAIGLVTFVTFDAFAFATVPSTLFLMIGCAGALWRMTIGEHSDSQAQFLRGQHPAITHAGRHT